VTDWRSKEIPTLYHPMLIDKACESFMDAGDTLNALEMWFRGFYSDKEIIVRLTIERMYAFERAEEELKENEESWEHG
jgi:hypothetical protein